MKVRFDISRREPGADRSYWQRIVCEGLEESDTVATALRRINADPDIRDVEGNTVREIMWESSCLQKKCGACAMRIDGTPMLACSAVLGERKAIVTLEPLRKFPVIADLAVDRSCLYEALAGLRVWLEQGLHVWPEQGLQVQEKQEINAPQELETLEREQEVLFESSRCLQCGCCLEVCPNFYVEGTFRGMAAMTPMTRILVETPSDRLEGRQKDYRKQIYEGCGKSLACRSICPAGIEIDRLLVRSNAIAIWNRRRRRQR